MLNLVLFLLAIGLVLFLWKIFPAFKWVLAVICGIPIIWFGVEIVDYQIKKINAIDLKGNESKINKVNDDKLIDNLNAKVKTDTINERDVYESEYKNNKLILTGQKCDAINNAHQNLLASYIDFADGTRLHECWFFDSTKNTAIIYRNDGENLQISELDFGNFKRR